MITDENKYIVAVIVVVIAITVAIVVATMALFEINSTPEREALLLILIIALITADLLILIRVSETY